MARPFNHLPELNEFLLTDLAVIVNINKFEKRGRFFDILKRLYEVGVGLLLVNRAGTILINLVKTLDHLLFSSFVQFLKK